MDFGALAAELLRDGEATLQRWLPGGRVVAGEYRIGNLRGDRGKSLSVNLETGKWLDRANPDDRGGDLISLYARIESISNGDAFKRLDKAVYNRTLRDAGRKKPAEPPPEPCGNLEPPSNGESGRWCYKDPHGQPLFWVLRYDTEDGKKFKPWRLVGGKWVQKGWPNPRPLYGLDEIYKYPKKPVMIVEGEKAADAARGIVGDKYLVTTAPNGTNAMTKADWGPLEGRRVIIWPDDDPPGIKAAERLSTKLTPSCREVKVINVEEGWGWDAANAAEEGWDWEKFYGWAKDKVALVQVNITQVENGIEQAGDAKMDRVGLWLELGLEVSDKGTVQCNSDTAERVIRSGRTYVTEPYYDEFTGRIFYTGAGGDVEELRDVDAAKLRNLMSREFGLKQMCRSDVQDAMSVVADDNKINSATEWAESLKWDGEPRIEKFLLSACGIQLKPYTIAVSRNFWMSLAARLLKPGCQVDDMMILEGKQGIGKSQMLRAIGDEWFATNAAKVTDYARFVGVIRGKALIEIDELGAFSKAEVSTIKSMVSTQTDRYRRPYARSEEDVPRQCVFVGTTNDSDYLRDPTGARRFRPVTARYVNLEYVIANREQMFAEAVSRVQGGEKWHLMPEDEAAAEADERRSLDPWESQIDRFLLDKCEVSTEEILDSCLQMDPERRAQMHSVRVGRIMRSIGWKSKTLWRDGRARRTWQRPDVQEPTWPA